MKALVVTADHRLELQEVSDPVPGEYQAVARILGCGICATTDRELVRGTQPFHQGYPAILGHESIGEIVRVGARVRQFRVGDRVTRALGILPGQTRDGLHSAWGGFSEYGLVTDWRAMADDGNASASADYTARRQTVVPPELSLPQAVLAISLAETASWFWHLPAVGGGTVCVAGTGIAGLSAALWARLAGARRVIVLGRRKWKLDLALELAADTAVDVTAGDTASQVRDAVGEEGVDLFIEAVGRPDQAQLGLQLVRAGGGIACYGVPEGLKYALQWGMDNGTIHLWSPPTEEHRGYGWVADLMRRGHIPDRRLMTHQWPMSEFETAFAEIEAGNVIKAMLIP